MMSILVGYCAVWMGELPLARRCFAEARIPALGILLFHEGDWESARASCEAFYRRSLESPEDSLSSSRDLARLLRVLGEPALGCPLLEKLLARFPLDEPHLQIEMGARPELALSYLELGRHDAAAEQVARCDEIVAAGEDWRGLAGQYARASAVCFSAGGDYQDADNQFAAATGIFNRLSLAFEEADTFHYWGRALQSAGETRRATEKFDSAIQIYRQTGAGQRWIDHVLADRDRVVQAAVAQPDRRARSVIQATWRKEGDYWTVTYRGDLFRIKDAKGLHYLAELLRKPNQQLFSIDLAALTANHELARATNGAMDGVANETVRDLGDAGEILDLEARAQYKRRLGDLREEIELAQRANDPGRTESTRAEFEAISEQLQVASGLGGRSRRAASHRERARVMVTKRIKASIESIRASNPALGRHLASSIRTGYVCTYSPIEPTDWQF